MSARNVELMRRFVAAYNKRDLDAAIACCDPCAELHPLLAGAVGGAFYRGHEGLRQWFRDLADAWGGEIRGELEAYFDLGEHTLGFATFRGRGRQSGAEVAMPIAVVTTWRNELLVNMKTYASRPDALRDLGVSEEQLEPISP